MKLFNKSCSNNACNKRDDPLNAGAHKNNNFLDKVLRYFLYKKTKQS